MEDSSSIEKRPNQPEEEVQSIKREPPLSREDYLLLKEYELSQEMHNYYGRVTWEIGSILIGSGIAAIALIVSRLEAPNLLGTIASLAIMFLMAIYFFKVRRTKKITEIHLRRCRQIKKKLGLLQHRKVRLAAEKGGTMVEDDTVEGKTNDKINVPGPTGWRTTQVLVVAVAAASLLIGIYYLKPDLLTAILSVFGDC